MFNLRYISPLVLAAAASLAWPQQPSPNPQATQPAQTTQPVPAQKPRPCQAAPTRRPIFHLPPVFQKTVGKQVGKINNETGLQLDPNQLIADAQKPAPCNPNAVQAVNQR